MLTFSVLAGLATGLVLGLLGSGGSIVILPALVYLLDVPTKSAVAITLGTVGLTAAIAALTHWRRGNIDIPVAIIFGAFGVAGTFAGTRIGLVTPEVVQLSLFATVMYVAAWRMIRPPVATPTAGALVAFSRAENGGATVCLDVRHATGVAALGIGVGVLAGVVGVGGGFMIVPALVLLAGLTMKEAVGTSLAIVTANTLTGFAGYVGKVPIDYHLMAIFAGVAIAGSFVGAAISKRLSATSLKRLFAIFLVVVASYIVFRQILGR